MDNGIKLTVGGQVVEVLIDTIDMDYQITNIETMGTVDSNKSFPISAPYTQANHLAFEHLNVLALENRLPYKKIPCTLEDNGTPLLKNGVCRIKKTGRQYELEIGGGNYDMVDAIKDLKLQDLDWAEYDHFWTLANVHASRNNTEGYIYLANNYFTDLATAPIDNIDRVIRVDYIYPCVFLHSILTKMGEYTGVAFQGDLLQTQNFKDLVLPFVRRDYVRNTDGRKYLAAFKFNNDIAPNSTIVYVYQNLQVTTPGTYFNLGSAGVFQNFFWFADDVTVTFKFTLFVEASFNGTIKIRYTYFDGFNQQTGEQLSYVNFISGTIVKYITLTSRRGISQVALIAFEFGVAIPGSGNRITADSTIEIVACTINKAGNISFLPNAGPNFVTLSSALPDMKCGDLLKALANMFGLLFQYDEASNTMKVEQIAKLYANKPKADDWTELIDPTTAVVEYELGNYGQNNRMVLSNPDGIDTLQGSYNFTIDNEHLAPEKEVFKLPFQWTDNVQLLEDLTVAHIPIIAAEEDPDVSGQYLYKLSGDSKPRILSVIREDVSANNLAYYDGVSTLNSSIAPLGYYYRADGTNNLDLNTLITANQLEQITMLKKSRKVTLEVALTANHINSLDFFVPVYIRTWAKYFYKNRISRKTKGMSKVVLVEL